jgi:hypothetical protein
MWSPKIHLDERDRFTGVVKEINRVNKGRKLICFYCNSKGASLGCSGNNDSCKKSYHYLCAKESDCKFSVDNNNFIIYCPIHKLEEEEIEEEYGVCIECHSGLDEEKLLICEKCKEVTHTYCNKPIPLDFPPEEDYFCYSCRYDSMKIQY